MNPAKRILCLQLPNWPVQRAEREGGWELGARSWGRHPKSPISRSPSQISNLKSQFSSSPSPQPPVPSPALLLHSRDPRRGNCVVACSLKVEAWGVRIGMPLAEASALAQRGGKFIALAHNPAADLVELARLAEMCERFSPCVGWETVDASTDWWPATGPAHLFLDIAGIGRLFDGEESLIAEIRRDFSQEGYEIQAAAADTIGAAWGEVQSVECKVQSEESQISNFKSQIPALHSAPYTLHSLRLPLATLSLLFQLGITRVDELLRLPRESLRSRFGERLLLRLDQLSGAVQETIVPHHPPPRFQAEWILEYPTDSRDLVEQIVSQLLVRIAQDLAERQEGVVRLACRFDGAGGLPLQLSVGLFRPSAQKDHLEELLRMQLEQAQLPRQIGRIGIAAQLTAPLENRQTELFADSSREASRDYALLIDRLASRLGPAAVLQPLLRFDPLPERAVSYVPVVGKKKSQVTGDKKRKRKSQISNLKSEIPNLKLSSVSCPLSSDSALRPLLLHHPPQPLAAISVVPNGPPVSFELEGQTHRIDRHWGPERIETGWWRGRSHRRDYYRVETTTGHRYWLFRRLADGKWHLHGEYG